MVTGKETLRSMTTHRPQDPVGSGGTVILTKVFAHGQMTMPMIDLIGRWAMVPLSAQTLVLQMTTPKEIPMVYTIISNF